jgi:hypothetical protein
MLSVFMSSDITLNVVLLNVVVLNSLLNSHPNNRDWGVNVKNIEDPNLEQ